MAGHGRILLEHDDPLARHRGALALVRVDEPGQALQKRRLARPVAPDQRQPVARADVDVEVPEQPALPLNEAEVFKRKHGRGHGKRL
jgi:hypothetical protein